MIKEFSTHVKQTNNKARTLFLCLLGASAVTAGFYVAVEKFKGVIGMSALLLIVVTIFVYTKFLSSVFFYDITFDYRGEPIFVVRQVTGRRQSTLARVSLRDIIKVEMETKAERKSHKTPYAYRKYTYFPTLWPENSCRLTVISPYEKSEVQIECSGEFADMLSQYSKEAKTYEITDEDDYEESATENNEN